MQGLLVPMDDAAALSRAIVYALSANWNPEIIRARALDFSLENQSDLYLNKLLQTREHK